MLFRSPLTRWFLAGVGLITGVIFAFGNTRKWRSTPSFHWLAQAPVPLQFWGWAFIAYALLLLPERTRAAAYAFGGVLFAIFTISLIATLNPSGPDPKNVVGVAAMLDVVAFHALAIRTAWNARLMP